MSYSCFEALKDQEQDLLETVVRTGDGPERVWSAWALALRLGSDSLPALAHDTQPDPGVRAHFAVILAGFGQEEALRALAASDPDPFVRATALDYLMRTASLERRPETARFIDGLLVGGPEEQLALRVLQTAPADWPPFSKQAIEALLSHPTPSVRIEAAHRLPTAVSPEDLPVELIRARLRDELDPRVLRALADACASPAFKRQLLAAAVRVTDAAAHILGTLDTVNLTADWKSLQALAQLDDPQIRLLCLKLCADWDSPEAVEWLTALAIGSWEVIYFSDNGSVSWRYSWEGAQTASEMVERFAADPGFTNRCALEPALKTMLSKVEEELDWYGTEEVDWLLGSGVDLMPKVEALGMKRDALKAAIQALQ
jgi:hypothetical protein